MLTKREQARYARQMMMAGWGSAGQEKLKRATVLVAGAGGLGSPASIYLAVAGVGRIRICDDDTPELSNLNRQILHDDSRIGMKKALSAAETLCRLNPDTTVEAVADRITEKSVDDLCDGADLIIDCMDNFPTRCLLNGVSVRRRIPLIHGSVWGMEGRLMVSNPPQTACLQCLFPEAPPKEVFPVLGATPGVIGTLQAMEAVKLLTGVGEPLLGRLMVWDGMEQTFQSFPVRRMTGCPGCG